MSKRTRDSGDGTPVPSAKKAKIADTITLHGNLDRLYNGMVDAAFPDSWSKQKKQLGKAINVIRQKIILGKKMITKTNGGKATPRYDKTGLSIILDSTIESSSSKDDELIKTLKWVADSKLVDSKTVEAKGKIMLEKLLLCFYDSALLISISHWSLPFVL